MLVGTELPGTRGLAARNRIGQASVFDDLMLTGSGAIWINLSDTAVCHFHSSEYRRGLGSGTSTHFARFLGIARGSLAEFETYMALCIELGYFHEEKLANLADEADQISKMIRSLQRTQQSK